MMLDLRAIADFPARVTMEEDASRLDVNVPGVAVTGIARVEMDIARSDNIYYCTGTVVCAATLECSRCLEPYPVTFRGEIDFSIVEAAQAAEVRRDELPDTAVIVPVGTSPVDITDPVREAILLEIPLKPLCRETCRGLCPYCGTNRNEQQCNCTAETTDPRWDGLRDLLK
jgi:uncharacterized protein